MSERLLKTLTGLVFCLCIPAFVLPGCASGKKIDVPIGMPPPAVVGMIFVAPMVWSAEAVVDTVEESVDKNQAAAYERWEETVRSEAENNPGRGEEATRQIVLKHVATLCNNGVDNLDSWCYALLEPKKRVNLENFVRKVERKEYRIGVGPPRFILGLLATSENVDKDEAAKLGMRPANSNMERLVRAALLRRALMAAPVTPRETVPTPRPKPDPRFQNTTLSRQRKLAEAVEEAKTHWIFPINSAIRPPDPRGIVPIRPKPDPNLQRLADRLLELDEALAREKIMFAPASHELYLGMDAEIRAYLGPESEFRLWADPARNHYLHVIRESGGGRESWHPTVTALIHADALAMDEAQRLEAVRLFVKTFPNQSPWLARIDLSAINEERDMNPLDLRRLEWIYGASERKDLQPIIWDWFMTEWRHDWSGQLVDILKRNKENKEISALLLKTYPPLPIKD